MPKDQRQEGDYDRGGWVGGPTSGDRGGKAQHESGPTTGEEAAGSSQLVKGTQVTATHTPWLPGSRKTAVQPGGKGQGLRQYLRWASGKGGKRGLSLGLVSFIGL